MTIAASEIAALHSSLTACWHEIPPAVGAQGLLLVVQQNHLRNFQLWHEEDLARRDDLGFEAVDPGQTQHRPLQPGTEQLH